MHTTAWKLVNDFVGESLPTFDVSGGKTPQGHGCVKFHILNLQVLFHDVSGRLHENNDWKQWFPSFSFPSTGAELEGGDATTFAAKNEPWLQATLTGFGSGVRRPDNERLIVWVNYVAAGVVSGKKLVFSVEQVTQLLHSFPRTAVAVVLLPNRASDLRSSPKSLADVSCFYRFWSVFLMPFLCRINGIFQYRTNMNQQRVSRKEEVDDEADETVKKQEGQ